MNRRQLVTMLCALSILLAVVPFVAPLWLTIFIIFIAVYIMLGVSWSLAAGQVGILSFGHVAFFGIGAYTVAVFNLYVISLRNHWFLDIPLGGFAAAIAAVVVGYPLLRIRGVYFAIGMLAFAEILRVLAYNSAFLQRGEGISLPLPTHYSIEPYYYVALILVFASLAITYSLIRSKYGKALNALRDNPEAASMIGINVTRYRIFGFMISAFMAGLAGAYFAHYNTYVHPDLAFAVSLSIASIIMGMVGGMRTFGGPILGAIIVAVLERIGQSYFPIAYQLLPAAAMIIVALFLPNGIMGSNIDFRKFVRQLFESSDGK